MTGDSQALAGRRILVVEDEYFIADEMARTLSRAGAQVLGPYPNTARASRTLEQEGRPPDAAVFDLHLAGKSPIELIRTLRSQGVPVVLATGYDVAAMDPELQALPRCEKPVDLHNLTKTLSQLMA